MPAVRFQVACVGASLAAARAARSCRDLRPSEKPARTTLPDETNGLIGILEKCFLPTAIPGRLL